MDELELKKHKIIHINELRKKKGLDAVENRNVYLDDTEDEPLDFFDEDNFYDLDDRYDEYIMASLSAKNDEERMIHFKKFLKYFQDFFEGLYEKETLRILDKSPLKEEINYAMQGAGKRLRPFLMYITYMTFEGNCSEELMYFMLAIELIHGFSLIHDDMPCMDNDELRHGKKSVWKKYGQAKALLTGDAMLCMAFEIAGYTLLDHTSNCNNATENMLDEAEKNGSILFSPEEFDEVNFGAKLSFLYTICMQILASTAGCLGMIAGQTTELDFQNKKDIYPEEIIAMYSNKTGALLSACMSIGYELSTYEDEKFFEEVEDVGRIMGALYQIKDDLDDIYLSTKELGKPAHSDEKNNKSTYIALRGEKEVKKDIKLIEKLLMSQIKKFDDRGINTRAIKDFIYFFMNKK